MERVPLYGIACSRATLLTMKRKVYLYRLSFYIGLYLLILLIIIRPLLPFELPAVFLESHCNSNYLRSAGSHKAMCRKITQK
jgi:hypothetical protein